jgi:hypothetical protein
MRQDAGTSPDIFGHFAATRACAVARGTSHVYFSIQFSDSDLPAREVVSD